MKQDIKYSRGLVGKKPTFHQSKDQGFSYRILLYLLLIVGGIFLVTQERRGVVEPLFQPTPTPTRTANSYLLEARAHFDAGRIEDPDPNRSDALKSYRAAVEIDPNDANLRTEFARILTYASSLQSTVEQRRERLTEAREQIDLATQLDPENSDIYAIRTFVYDWLSNPLISGDLAEDHLQEARQSSARALQLNPNNASALAYYAEVLVDQQEWVQAEKYAKQAVELNPRLMDAHRIYGYVNESLGLYNAAIESYLLAAEINPNLTFLYINIGLNFRTLKVYNRALEYFEKAANINNALGVNDPNPYIEIAKTYAQIGEFFIASRNGEKALSFDPTNSNTYGQLGSIYVQARNFEGALPILACAVEGCTVTISPEEITQGDVTLMTCPVAGCTVPDGNFGAVQVQALPLSSLTVAYYYIRYGSVLAALDMCNEAIPVLAEVGAAYPDDPVIGAIIDENYNICGR